MQQRLMIVDGNSIINRAFYGVRMLSTKDNIPTNAVYGFLNIWYKYIEELDKIISKDRYVNLVGLTDLRQMAIVISRSTVVVSGDSGPMHMAYSLGRFVIALMGPTDPVQFGPYGNKNKIIRVNHECRGCQLTVCPFGRDCLFDINPCDVIKELQIILESGGIRV